MIDLSQARWHKSSYSGGANTDCVEVAGDRGELGGLIAVRDTKNRDGHTLVFPVASWSAFLEGIKTNGLATADRFARHRRQYQRRSSV